MLESNSTDPPIIIKWRTDWRNEITRVECTRQTLNSVWLLTDLDGKGKRLEKPRREARNCTRQSYHDSWEQARDHLLRVAETRLAAARRELEKAQGYCGNIKGMKPPTPNNHA